MSPNTSDWTLVVSGGGSGGHLFPALAVIEALRERPDRPARILFLTAERSIEQAILSSYELEQVPLPAVESNELRRQPIRSIWRMGRAIAQARRLLKQTVRPIVLATGGFGSLPGGIAAWRNKIPLILLEQNAVAGRAISLLSPLATHLCTSFQSTEQDRRWTQKTIWTGNPIRADIAKQTKDKDHTVERVMLVLGGSQGARRINQAMVSFAQSAPEQLQGWQIMHHTGQADAPKVQAAYAAAGIRAEVSSFFENMPDRYRQASFVVSRAGGTSLAEFACAGLPALLIPYPNSLRDHQDKNAQRFVNAGAALAIRQQNADFENDLAQGIISLINNAEQRQQMSLSMTTMARPDAAQCVSNILLECLNRST